jgi:hypothetical protein
MTQHDSFSIDITSISDLNSITLLSAPHGLTISLVPSLCVQSNIWHDTSILLSQVQLPEDQKTAC